MLCIQCVTKTKSKRNVSLFSTINRYVFYDFLPAYTIRVITITLSVNLYNIPICIIYVKITIQKILVKKNENLIDPYILFKHRVYCI